jgi:ABC-type lipoprotein release transport system permease subunit
MLPALIVLVFAVAIAVLVLVLLAVVVAGIRREGHTTELSSRPPSPISALARRLIGIYVRKPYTDDADSQPDPCPAGRGAEGP